MKRHELDKKGYITLMSVLIISAIVFSLALFSLSSDNTSIQNIQAYENSLKAKWYARECAYRALEEIRNNAAFEGVGGGRFCSYTVIKEIGQRRTVEAVGEYNLHVKSVRVEVETINPQMNISLWEEI